MVGYEARATDGAAGTVRDFLFDDAKWTVRYVVIDTGPWLFGRRVLISPVALGRPAADEAILPVRLPQGQVESAPEIDLAQPVSRQQLRDLNEHYGWPATWTDDPLLGTTYIGTRPQIRAEEGQDEQAPEPADGDRHLRSANEVISYRIVAQDGEIGHVEDLFANDEGWAVRYFLVDTRSWLPGRKVILATDWIERVGWTDGLVQVQVTQEQVRDSPEYDPKPPPSREYEADLYRHYRFPAYWT
jgi:hypothetical protein